MSTIEAIEHRDAAAALRRLATPNALAMIGDQLLGIVDTIAIGTLGAAALAAITGAVSVFMVCWIGLFAFGTGVRIVGAQAIGAGTGERFGAIVRSAMVVPLAIALGCVLGSFVVGRPLLHAMLPAGAPVNSTTQSFATSAICPKASTSIFALARLIEPFSPALK